MNFDALFQVMVMSMSVSAMALTITRSRVFHEVREFIKARNGWLGDLVSCHYCTSHWLAIGFTAVYRPQIVQVWIGVDLVTTMFVMVAMASLCSGVIQKLINVGHYMDAVVPEDEDEYLDDAPENEDDPEEEREVEETLGRYGQPSDQPNSPTNRAGNNAG